MPPKKALKGVILLFAFLLSLIIFLANAKNEMVDFQVNYTAGQRLLRGETLYRGEDGHYQFKYPPFAALLYLPLALLPLSLAKAVWFYIVLISSGCIFYLSCRLINPETKTPFLVAFLPPLILAKFFLRELQLGQINAIITCLLILMVWLLVKKDNPWPKQNAAGLILGFATALKPYALIFFPYLLLKKKWKAAGCGLLFLAGAFLTPALYFGFRGNWLVHKEWQESLSLSTLRLLSSQDNISLVGMMMKWTGSLKISLAACGIMAALLACLIFVLIRKGEAVPSAMLLESALLLSLIPLLSPLGWDYTLLSSAPAVILILKHFHNFPRLGRLFLGLNFFIIAFSLYDILGRELYGAFMSWSVITINFFMLIGYLAFLRLKRYS